MLIQMNLIELQLPPL